MNGFSYSDQSPEIITLYYVQCGGLDPTQVVQPWQILLQCEHYAMKVIGHAYVARGIIAHDSTIFRYIS